MANEWEKKYYGQLKGMKIVKVSFDEEEDAVTDLLSDLRHFCDDMKVDINLCWARSQAHHENEKES